MEHESFEDTATARIMNEHFICIKVDREERPDIDQVYMNAVQLMTGRGGWPLNCFALPDGRPFMVALIFRRLNGKTFYSVSPIYTKMNLKKQKNMLPNLHRVFSRANLSN
jgi:uncharacterized protein YyaL (SSP411 family)